MMKVLYNRRTGIYKCGNNTYPRRIGRRSNLGPIFGGKKVRLLGQEIWYVLPLSKTECCFTVPWDQKKGVMFI